MKTQRVFSKIAKYLFIVATALVVLCASMIYILPGILQSKLVDIIQETTGRKTSLGKVVISPVPFQLSLHDFAMQELNGQPFAGFSVFDIKLNTYQSILQGALVIDRIALIKPTTLIARQKNGDFNFKDLIKPSADEKKEEESSSVFPVNIAKLSISEGKLGWKDAYLSKPEKEDALPIDLEVTNFSTQASTLAESAFSLALSSGGKFAWKGNVGINPVASSGHIKLDQVQLQRIKNLALQDLPYDLQGSELIDLDYQFTKTDNDMKLVIKQSNIELHDLQLTESGTNNLQVKIPKLALTGGYELNVNKDLKLVVKQSKLAIQNVQVAALEQGNTQVSLPNITLEGDYDLKQAEKSMTLAVTNSKLALQEVQVATDQPGRIVVKAPALTLEGKYNVSQADKQLDVSSDKAKFSLKNLQLSEQGQSKTLVSIPDFAMQGIDFDLSKQQLTIADASASDATIQSWLDKQGVINYQSLFAPPKTPTAATSEPVTVASKPVETDNKPWDVQVKNVSINNFGLNFEDQSLKKPATMTAKPINVKLTDLSTKAGAKLPFQVNLGINKNGSIKLNGDAVISPLAAKIKIAVKDIDLEKFQPYVEKFAKLDIIDGAFNVDGNLTLATKAQDKLDIKFKGNTGIAKLLTRDQIKNKDFLKWENLALKDINADVLANQYSASALVINKPYARVIINKDKTVNISDIMVADKDKAKTAAPAKTKKKTATKEQKSPDIHFKLGKVQVIDGSSDFADLSLILPFAAQIKSLDGGASGISSEQKSNIKVDLKGNAYDLAPVTINGDISPYLGDYNIALNFDGMPMPLISPYMAQFAGYKIEKGKMTLGLNYKVTKGQLTASNNILIDQFELGEKVEHPDAVSLPLELAIALMKDSEGKIKIDVPITGSLEDPQFSIGHIIVDALFNVITKIVTSPFKALGSLMEGDEDPSTIIFAAGSAELGKAEISKLDNVTKALKEKSQLNIDIKGTAFQDQDWPQLSDDALYDQMKHLRADQINKEGGRKIRAENVELTEDDYNEFLAQLFMEKFPLMAEKSIFGKPKLVPPEAGDFYAVAKQKLSGIIKPEQQRLKDLAAERAKAIAKYLVQKGGIGNERVYILDSAVDPKRENTDIASVLSLKVN